MIILNFTKLDLCYGATPDLPISPKQNSVTTSILKFYHTVTDMLLYNEHVNIEIPKT